MDENEDALMNVDEQLIQENQRNDYEVGSLSNSIKDIGQLNGAEVNGPMSLGGQIFASGGSQFMVQNCNNLDKKMQAMQGYEFKYNKNYQAMKKIIANQNVDQEQASL